MNRILLATSNPHKLDEIRAVIPYGLVELVSLADVQAEHLPEPVEDADTFEGNALIKARSYAKAVGMPCMADDSGLEVDALNGAPGVQSARYSGATGGREIVDPANNRKLLEQLQTVPAGQRTARFVCHMVLVDPASAKAQDPPLASVRGTIEGRILLPEETADTDHPERGRGSNGFGYDPLFLVPHLGKTTAELSPTEKNAISHRGDASRKMLTVLQAKPAG